MQSINVQDQAINKCETITKTKNTNISCIGMQTICTNEQYLNNYLLTVLNEKNTSKFDESFINYYDENSDKGYIFEIDFEYPKEFHNLYNNIPFLPE